MSDNFVGQSYGDGYEICLYPECKKEKDKWNRQVSVALQENTQI
jgi:hypothetical protein